MLSSSVCLHCICITMNWLCSSFIWKNLYLSCNALLLNWLANSHWRNQFIWLVFLKMIRNIRVLLLLFILFQFYVSRVDFNLSLLVKLLDFVVFPPRFNHKTNFTLVNDALWYLWILLLLLSQTLWLLLLFTLLNYLFPYLCSSFFSFLLIAYLRILFS